MNPYAAQTLGRELLAEHGLTGWSCVLDNAKRRFGQCRYGRRQISLSRALVALNDETQVRDTILHEIAHALVGPGHGHDHVWKAMCRTVGADPKRCYDTDDVSTPQGRYVATCGRCGKQFHRHKRVAAGRKHWCLCHPRNKHEFVLEWVDTAVRSLPPRPSQGTAVVRSTVRPTPSLSAEQEARIAARMAERRDRMKR